MKKLMLLGITVVWLSLMAVPAGAQIFFNIQLPPVVFSAPPAVVVLPGTNVYVAPDVDVDIFFFDGWWWRPYNGRWYRSHYYDRGWSYYYYGSPRFYRDVPDDWRRDYRDHRWEGRPWNYERMPHGQVEKNWNQWEKDHYWEKQRGWGVQGGYQPHPHPAYHQNHPQGHGPQPQGHENYQHPQGHENYQQPQGHENYQHPPVHEQPHGQPNQPHQEHMNQHQGHNEAPPAHQKQHEEKGSKGEGKAKGHEKH